MFGNWLIMLKYLPTIEVLVSPVKELINDCRKLKALFRAWPRNEAVERVYKMGLIAALKGNTNTAIHANTCKQ